MKEGFRAVTARQMREIDRKASEESGVPSIVLMENAGRGAAEEILRMVEKKNRPRVVVVCGTGNNGGDGCASARHLMIHGLQPKVFILGEEDQLRGDARINYSILKKEKGRVRFGRPSSDELAEADLVVDAVFGIGLNRRVSGVFEEVIDDMNRYAGGKSAALDIPSGLDADTGDIHGVCVRARRTITFHLPKKGLFLGDGPKYTGEVVVVHIGIGGGVSGREQCR